MKGIIFAILSAVFAAATAILAKVGVKNVDSNLAVAIRTSVVLLMSWGIVFFTGTISQIKTISKATIWFLVFSGIATGLSWLCYFKAIQLTELSKVAPIDKLSVVITVVFSVFFLGETMDLKTIIGVGLILVGVLVMVI